MPTNNLIKNMTRLFSDPETYNKAQKHMITEAVAENFYNKFKDKGVFKGICLSGGPVAENVSTTSLFHPIKVRVEDIFDELLPDPCGDEFAEDTDSARYIINMHPTVLPFGPLGAGERTPGFGEEIDIEFIDSHPNDSGKMRGFRYYYPKQTATYNYKCANQELQSLVGQFAATGPVATLASFQPVPTANPKSPPVSVKGVREIRSGAYPWPNNVVYKIQQGLPAAPNDGSGGATPTDVDGELRFWKGKNERNPTAYPRLRMYWDNVRVPACPGPTRGGRYCWTPTGMPWSAAFVSYIMRDTGLKGGASHYKYIRNVLNGKSPGWSAYSIMKNTNCKINVGDILVKARRGSRKPNPPKKNATHGDVVFKIENGNAYLVGGNVSSTAKIVGSVPLDENGRAKNTGIYVIILKKEAT